MCSKRIVPRELTPERYIGFRCCFFVGHRIRCIVRKVTRKKTNLLHLLLSSLLASPNRASDHASATQTHHNSFHLLCTPLRPVVFHLTQKLHPNSIGFRCCFFIAHRLRCILRNVTRKNITNILHLPSFFTSCITKSCVRSCICNTHTPQLFSSTLHTFTSNCLPSPTKSSAKRKKCSVLLLHNAPNPMYPS